MLFAFKVEVEINRVEGKFATRDEMCEQIREAIEGADYGTWDGENGGQYETLNWEITDA